METIIRTQLFFSIFPAVPEKYINSRNVFYVTVISDSISLAFITPAAF